MKRLTVVPLSVVLLAATLDAAHAYEVPTHAAITYNAYKRSTLSTDSTVRKLGIDFYTQFPGTQRVPFGNVYYDAAGDSVLARNWYFFEYGKMPFVADSSPSTPDGFDPTRDIVTVPGWLMIGAVREDDNPKEPNPKDDPYVQGGAFHREFNHFFDPAKNRALSVLGPLLGLYYGQTANGVTTVRRAPDWAIGVDDAFGDTTQRGSDTLNHFTVFDAREAMFRALTLRRLQSNGTLGDLAPNAAAADREAIRKTYWATTFRALGDILHLNQDMAQPQHTRNEPHAGGSGSILDPIVMLVAGHTSAYEKYIESRTTATYPDPAARNVKRFYTLDGEQIPLAPLGFGSYTTPTFDRYSDYWSTGQGAASLQGKGLADYSNRGFFTMANNVNDLTYTAPSTNAGDYTVQDTMENYPGLPGLKKKYLLGDVPDFVAGPPNSIRMTTMGLYSDFVTELGVTTVAHYTLDAKNYDDQASLLLPRAVAYSAGLLDYFFRGSADINLPDAGFYSIVDHSQFAPPNQPTNVGTGFKGFGRIKLKLKNTTPSVTPPGGQAIAQDMGNGILVAVVKFRRSSNGTPDGNCYDDLLTMWPTIPAAAQVCRSDTEEIVVSNPVTIDANNAIAFANPESPNGREYTFDFADQLPINAWDVMLQVVFRGRLGLEGDAVVVATKDISEPTYATIMNTTDHVVLNGTIYLPEDVNSNQALLAQVKSDCRSGTPGNYTLWAGCYRRSDETFLLAGTSGVGIAATGETAIPSGGFARIALLTELSTPAVLSVQPGTNCTYNDSPLTVPAYQARLNVQGTWGFGPPSVFRGVKGWKEIVCFEDIGNAPTPFSDDLQQQLSLLPPANTSPTPITITGW